MERIKILHLIADARDIKTLAEYNLGTIRAISASLARLEAATADIFNRSSTIIEKLEKEN